MNWSYLFKHWFSTIFFTPIIHQIVLFFDNSSQFSISVFFELFFIFLILGFFLSIPTYLLYGLTYYCLVKINFKYPKPILISLSVIGIIVTANNMNGTEMPNISLAYCITSIITGLFFKLNIKNEND